MQRIPEPAREVDVVHETDVLVVGSGPGAGESGGEARRAGADDEQFRLVDDVDLAGGLVDRPEAATACHVRARGSALRRRAPRSPAP